MATPMSDTVNVDLTLDVWDQITLNPMNWYQAEWRVRWEQVDPDLNRCGTAMCFAGWAVELSELEFMGEVGTSSDCHVQVPGLGTQHVGRAAEALLGFNREVAIDGDFDNPDAYTRDLFGGENSLEDIRTILTVVLGDDPDVLSEKRRAERGLML